MNTPEFYKHPQIIHISKTANTYIKLKFIHTCDAHIEAGTLGHTFGLNIMEFSVNQKPIIAYNGSVWNDSHIQILGYKGIYYSNEKEIKNIIYGFDKNDFIGNDLNCYRSFSPEIVMNKFKELIFDLK